MILADPYHMRSYYSRTVRIICAAIVLVVLTASFPFENAPRATTFDPEDFTSEWDLLDTNDDGQIDYAVISDSDGLLIRAAMDYSGDGRFDNFYAYHDGQLVLHEIDSNSDGAIDLRVFVIEGNQIAGFEQDTNHDGRMDLEEFFYEEVSQRR